MLASAWRGTGGSGPDRGWNDALMERIRSSEFEEGDLSILNGFSLKFLRISAAVAAAALILLAWTMSSGLVPYQDLAAHFIDNPVGLFISPLFV
jgi:hypothetical protein